MEKINQNQTPDKPIEITKMKIKSTESDSGRESIHDSDDEAHSSPVSRQSKAPLLDDPSEELKLALSPEDANSVAASEDVDDEVEEDQEHNQDQGPHLLSTPWSFYYRANKAIKESREPQNLETQQLASVESIEQFWQVLNHINPPTKIQKRIGPNFMFFREDIHPEWEDPANVGGGSWGLVLTSKVHREQLNSLWYETLISCVGELIEHSEYITGVVLQRRQREDRIQLWTRCADEEEIQMKIGRSFKQQLCSLLTGYDSVSMSYTKHNDMEQLSAQHRPLMNRWSSLKGRTSSTASSNGAADDTESLKAPLFKGRAQSGAPRRGSSSTSNCSRDFGKAGNGNTSYIVMLGKLDRLKI